LSKDGRRYIGDLLKWKERLTKTPGTEKQKPVFNIVTVDVKALFPSLCKDIARKGSRMCSGEAFHRQNQNP